MSSEIPHHVSSSEMIDSLMVSMATLLKTVPKPTLITAARYVPWSCLLLSYFDVLVIINIGTLDSQALYPTQTQASDRGTSRKDQIDWKTATFPFQFLLKMFTNQKENLDIESGLIQFRAFCMQPFKGL